MFPNTPEEVEVRLRRMPIEAVHPRLRYLAAAGFLTQHYLGTNLALDRGDPFLRADRLMIDGKNWELPARVTQIAQILFDLRHDPGFPEICRRLSSRDLQSAFAEASAAAMFKQHGFAIEARPESYRKTKDFDFTIRAADAVANVEVTALRSPTFVFKSVLSRLKDKRKQLPSDKPAVLMCFYPNEWREQTRHFESALIDMGMQFFRSSQRVNYLFLSREEFIDYPPHGGALEISSMCLASDRPRHPSGGLERLQDKPTMHDAVEAMEHSPESACSPGEFHRWVDWAITRSIRL